MKNKPYRYYLYLLLKAVIGLIRCVPRPLMLALASGLGFLGFHLVARQRNLTLENLRTAFAVTKTEKEIRLIGRRVFQNLAMTLVDWIHMRHLNASNIEKVVNLNGVIEKSRELLKEGKGLIFISGHLGNWELMGTIYGMFGFSGGVIGRRIYYEKYNDLIVGARLEKGVPTFYQDSNPRELLRQLKRGGVIGVVADQDVEKLEGVFVNYFGRPAYTPIAPIKLAEVTGAPILIGALIRKGSRYEVVLEREPLRVSRGASPEKIQELTQRWSASLEKWIRQYPEQWVWMHNRWKTRADNSQKNSLQDRNFKQKEVVSPLC